MSDTNNAARGGRLVLAGVGGRFVAMLLDGLIYGALIGIPVGLAFALFVGDIASMDPADAENARAGMLVPVIITLVAVVGLWILIPMQLAGPKAGTWGKQIMGLKVLTTEGKRLSFGKAFLRLLVQQLLTAGITCGLGYLTALFTKRKQTLHDMLAGTVVVTPAKN